MEHGARNHSRREREHGARLISQLLPRRGPLAAFQDAVPADGVAMGQGYPEQVLAQLQPVVHHEAGCDPGGDGAYQRDYAGRGEAAVFRRAG